MSSPSPGKSDPRTPLPPIPAKRYFTIGEVSELCGVKPYVLRYWEQEFSQLKPMKRRGNRRYYQHHEVLLIRRIRELLYEQGFTISGARNRLADAPPGPGDYAALAMARRVPMPAGEPDGGAPADADAGAEDGEEGADSRSDPAPRLPQRSAIPASDALDRTTDRRLGTDRRRSAAPIGLDRGLPVVRPPQAAEDPIDAATVEPVSVAAGVDEASALAQAAPVAASNGYRTADVEIDPALPAPTSASPTDLYPPPAWKPSDTAALRAELMQIRRLLQI